VGSDFFTLSARLSRSFPISGRVELNAAIEAFNLTNRANVITRNTNFGTGSYPEDPLPSFGQITAMGDPRSVQLAVRLKF
jgi:hypothetical protein